MTKSNSSRPAEIQVEESFLDMKINPNQGIVLLEVKEVSKSQFVCSVLEIRDTGHAFSKDLKTGDVILVNHDSPLLKTDHVILSLLEYTDGIPLNLIYFKILKP